MKGLSYSGVAFCLFLTAVSAARADTAASWNSATSGNWTTVADWSTTSVYPNNLTSPGTNYQATIAATGSAYTVTLNSNVTVDAVTLNSANAKLLQSSGTFNPGTLTLSKGTYSQTGGTLTSSTVDLNGGTFDPASSGTLNNVTFSGGDLVLNNSGTGVIISKGLTVTDQKFSLKGEIAFDGPSETLDNMTITSNQSLIFLGAPLPAEGDIDTLTLGSNAVFQGTSQIADSPFSGSDTLINNGTINANTNGSALTVSSHSFTNNGTIEATNGGQLVLGLNTANFTNNGTLAVHGGSISLSGNLNVGTGTLTGTGTITADVVLANDPSTLAFQIGGTSQGVNYDHMNIAGFITLGGNLSIDMTNGFVPSGSNTFTVLNVQSPGTLSDSFLNVASGGELITSDGTGEFQVFYGGSGQFADEIVLTNYQAIPEPASVAVLFGGTFLLAARRRTVAVEA